MDVNGIIDDDNGSSGTFRSNESVKKVLAILPNQEKISPIIPHSEQGKISPNNQSNTDPSD